MIGGWHGNYKNWSDAKIKSIGYDSDSILQRVKDALLKVKNGEAVYERDSFLFDKIEYSMALLTGLLLVAGIENKELNVLDFGGSLGASYFQNMKFINYFNKATWAIVEQDNFYNCGKKYFEDKQLKFYNTIEDYKKK